jgi:hypothetical protein
MWVQIPYLLQQISEEFPPPTQAGRKTYIYNWSQDKNIFYILNLSAHTSKTKCRKV